MTGIIENVYLFFNSSCEICEYSDADVNYAVRFTPITTTADLYEVKNDNVSDTTCNELIGYLEFVDAISNNEQVRHGLMEWLWTGPVDENEILVLKA
jgi:hypothetical protein